jgi:hypothetical protein
VVHLSHRGTWWAQRQPWEQGWEDFAAARRLYARLQRRGKE